MSETRLPVPSQSSKNSSIWTVWGWTPPNSGLVVCLAALFVGRFHVADLLMDSSFGLKRNRSGAEPSSGTSVALGMSRVLLPGVHEAVVGQLERLVGDLVAGHVEGRARPLDWADVGEVPAADDRAIGVEHGDLGVLALHLRDHLRDPAGDGRRVLVDRPGQLDVGVLATARQPVDVVVEPAFLVLEDLVLHREALALGPG